MDSDRFDRLAKSLGSAVSRRGTLGALLGAGLAGALGGAEARKKRHGARGAKRRGAASVSAEASCASPGPSANLSGCNFNDGDFSGDDLSGSRMVGTTFRNAALRGTNLSSSNMKQADLRGAGLCGANLRSSTLKDADLRGADLTRADLSSSGCSGARFNNAVFCRTRTCTGAIRDDGCPEAVDPADVCCSDADCTGGDTCQDGICTPPPFCAGKEGVPCRPGADCGDPCYCLVDLAGKSVCGSVTSRCAPCTTNTYCEQLDTFGPGAMCVQAGSCCTEGVACVKACPLPT